MSPQHHSLTPSLDVPCDVHTLHCHAQTRDELVVLVSWSCLGKSIRDHLFCRLELEHDHSFCNLFTQKVKLDVDLLRARVIHGIFGKRDATLIVLENRRRYLGSVVSASRLR